MITHIASIGKHLLKHLHAGNKPERRFERVSYSQYGEDILIGRIFPKKTDGYYVDVGAYQPHRYSLTHLLYKKGWRGINIEPDSDNIALFNAYRKNDINLRMGVSDQKGNYPFYVSASANCSTFSLAQKEFMEKKSLKFRYIREDKVLCMPLQDILDTHNIRDIDLLNIDVEGWGLKVLKSNNWNKYKPRLIVIEDETFDIAHPEASNIFTFLTHKSYSCQAVMGLSVFYHIK